MAVRVIRYLRRLLDALISSPAAGDLSIGRNYSGATHFFAGDMDEMAVWIGAGLTAEQVAAMAAFKA